MMKTVVSIVALKQRSFLFRSFLPAGLVFLFSSFPFLCNAQAITEIITDYGGLWKSSSVMPNPVKPDNAHNLLAFTYNGTRYSTGVNDNLLAAQGLSFQQCDFWSLPVSDISGTITSNTKVGLGALYDGVPSGASNPAPPWGIATYLTEGTKGLGLGTCIANLPVGFMSFRIDDIQPGAIGDGIPDILVTQVADPTGSSYDRYEFTDASGVRVGTYRDIVFTNISPVGTWTADFYEAVNDPLTLQAGFTRTDRPLRLWAADLSELGVTVDNYQQIENFRINLCGNSDVAFVAYNSSSIDFNGVLPVQYDDFTATVKEGKVSLQWQTVQAQANADEYLIERSEDASLFLPVGTVKIKHPENTRSNYFFTDHRPLGGKAYYRLKLQDESGGTYYSRIVRVHGNPGKLAIHVFPNPSNGRVTVLHPATSGLETLTVYNETGHAVVVQQMPKGSQQTNLDLAFLPPGNYFISFLRDSKSITVPFVIR